MTLFGAPQADSPLRRLEQEAWVRPGERVTVRGFEITGGLFYLGHDEESESSAHPRIDSSQADLPTFPALVDPNLDATADSETPSSEGRGIAYESMTAAERADYLSWLAGPREVRNASLKTLELYVIGLERRLLFGSIRGTREWALLVAELDRVSREASGSGALSGSRPIAAARRLLKHVAALMVAREIVEPEDPADAYPDDDSTFGLRVAMGRIAARGERLPARRVLAWIHSAPEFELPRPARRCPVEFDDNFVQIYEEETEGGLYLPVETPSINLTYSPLNWALPPVIHELHIPDIAESEQAIRALNGFVYRAASDLEACSRWLMRNPGKSGSLEAASLLPARIINRERFPQLDRISEWLAQQDVDEGTSIDAGHLLGLWQGDGEQASAADASLLTRMVEKLGYGIEPDQRFGGPTLAPGEPAILFRRASAEPRSPTAEYSVARMTLHFLTAVAVADGVVTEEEEQFIERHLEEAVHLERDEVARLRAHVKWLIEARPDLEEVKRRMALLDYERRVALGRNLVAIAAADGNVDREELALISRTVTRIGLVFDGEDLPEAPVPGRRDDIPDSDGAIDLDDARIRRTIEETAAASSYLEQIFSPDETSEGPGRREDESSVSAPSVTDNDSQSPLGGEIDSRHFELLEILITQDSWNRAEVEQIAASHRLMPDGALEMINEYAFDELGEPIFEGEGTVDVNTELGKEIIR